MYGPELLKQLIESNTPFAAGKIGATELHAINKLYNPLTEKMHPIPLTGNIEYQITGSAGIHPLHEESFVKFCKYYLNGLSHIDALCLWTNIPFENVLDERYASSDRKLIDLGAFDPNPIWTRSLSDKKIAIVSPFVDDYKYQMDRFSFWDNQDWFPQRADFQFIESNYSQIIDPENGYLSWDEENKRLQNELMNLHNIDLVLIGCGAIGLPLASWVKTEMKTSAIHMGGPLQLLFGVMGKRWEHRDFNNEDWIRPSRQVNGPFSPIDGRCYF